MEKRYIKNVTVEPLRAELMQPFRIALGEHKSLENLLFTIECEDGTKGYGEAAIATHITGETIEATKKNLEAIGNEMAGKDPRDYLGIAAGLRGRLSGNKAALAAIEMALLDVLSKRAKVPLWRFFGDGSERLVTDITIVLSSLKESEENAGRFYEQGFRTFKVKVGTDPQADLERAIAVRRAVRDSRIILDANQGYSADEALAFLKEAQKSGVRPELIEQPVPKDDWEGLKEVTRSSAVPVCADESCQSMPDCMRIIEEKAAHAINIKLMKSGLIESREMAILARAGGLGLMIGSMMETSLAATAAANLAFGLGFFNYVDLDTPFFIKGAAAKNPFLKPDGAYELQDLKLGIGISPGQL